MPHFTYHLQIFSVDDINESVKVMKYCLWEFYSFGNLTCFHFIFLIKCVYSASELHFWVRELVVVTLHHITEVSQECDLRCLFFLTREKGYLWIWGVMERTLRRWWLSLTVESDLVGHKFSNELHLLAVVSHFSVNYIVKIYSWFILLNYIMKIRITLI